MVHFLAYSDESENPGGTRVFSYAGWCAPIRAWDHRFTERWQKEVLDGPPEIPSFHTANMNDPTWRAANGIVPSDAEARIDKAISIIEETGWMHPFAVTVESDLYFKQFGEMKRDLINHLAKIDGVPSEKVRLGQPLKSFFLYPDFVCFSIYCIEVLKYAQAFPGITTVEFVVERKQGVSNWLDQAYEAVGRHHQVSGSLTPVSKDSKKRPLEAADLLCWYLCQRALKIDPLRSSKIDPPWVDSERLR
jgi:hypothetical protein